MALVDKRDCKLAGVLAERLRAASRELTERWLDRIVARVSIERNRVFPTEELLDHVPLLIVGIADYLDDPSREIGVDTPVVGKAMELGQLRHAQGFDAYQIMKEYELLGGILFSFLTDAADELEDDCPKGDLLACGHRLFQAIAVIQQNTTNHFLRLADARVAEREDRLRAFNRAVSHEIKNRIGAVMGASDLLQEGDAVAADARARLVDVISRNTHEMRDTVENLLALSRINPGDARQHRHVHLPESIREGVRSVRDAARSAGMEIRVVGEVPDVEVNAAVVELSLSNFLGNAIKYRDRTRTDSFAEITTSIESHSGHPEVVVRVSDNGLGVPLAKREMLFQRFFRAHASVTGVEGTGLGLSIVRETAASIGGRAWAEFPAVGSVFAFSLPYRRESVRRTDDR